MSPFFLFVLTKFYIEKWNRRASHRLAVMHDLYLRYAEYIVLVQIPFLEYHGNGFILFVICREHHDRFMEMRIEGFSQCFDLLHTEAFHDLDELFLQELEALYISRGRKIQGSQ